MFRKRIRNYIFQTYKSFPLFLLFLGGILPALTNRNISTIDITNAELVLQRYHSFFYPICIMYLFVIVFYPYVEGEGRELLYVHQRMHFFEALMLFLSLCMILFFSVFFYWNKVLNCPVQFYIKNIIILWCFLSLCYFLLYAFNNITVMIIGSVLFFLVTILNPLNVLNVLPYEIKTQTNIQIIYSMKEYIIISIVCLLFGLILNKRYHNYITG